MLFLLLALQTAIIPPKTPASPAAVATASAPPIVGAVVTTRDGIQIGAVIAVAPDIVVVSSTGATPTRLSFSFSDFSKGGMSPVLVMSAAQLATATATRDRDIANSRAPLLHAGTVVVGADSAPIGHVSDVSNDYVVVDVDGSGLVKIPSHSFIGAGDVLVMAWSREQIAAMMKAHR